jgi:hypothetical protein
MDGAAAGVPFTVPTVLYVLRFFSLIRRTAVRGFYSAYF